MKKPEILCIGGSAGSYHLILDLLATIPTQFQIPLVVIIHRNERYDSKIEENLNKRIALRVKVAEDKEAIQAGTIYFAPAGYHLLIEPDFTFSLDISAPLNFCRPAIDVTFETAAEAYQDRCCGILLSGANQDGAKGLLRIQEFGGICLVQDPVEAEISTMPQAALTLWPAHPIYTYNELKKIIIQMTYSN